MKRFSHVQYLIPGLVILATAACKPVSPSPAPGSHIDDDERRQVASLTPIRGPVQQEVDEFQQDIRRAFKAEDFAYLEQQAQALRQEPLVFRNGTWKIYKFYKALCKRGAKTESDMQADHDRLLRWNAAMPQSATAKVALANFLIDYAWFARGSGYANTVTDEGLRKMQARLAEAKSVLDPVKLDADADPYWGTVMLTVALGQGWPKAQYDALTTRIKHYAPTYWHCDYARAYSLLPRWYGRPGDLEKYAAWAADQPDGLGDEVYARLAITMLWCYKDIFHETRLKWPRVKNGLQTMLKEYPESVEIMNHAARLAVLGGDREMARTLFVQLGDSYVRSAWDSPEQFVDFRTWANTGKW